MYQSSLNMPLGQISIRQINFQTGRFTFVPPAEPKTSKKIKLLSITASCWSGKCLFGQVYFSLLGLQRYSKTVLQYNTSVLRYTFVQTYCNILQVNINVLIFVSIYVVVFPIIVSFIYNTPNTFDYLRFCCTISHSDRVPWLMCSE